MGGIFLIGCFILLIVLLISKDKDIIIPNVYTDDEDDDLDNKKENE